MKNLRTWLNTFRPRQVVAWRSEIVGNTCVISGTKPIDVNDANAVWTVELFGGLCKLILNNLSLFPYCNITAQRALRVLDSIEDTPND